MTAAHASSPSKFVAMKHEVDYDVLEAVISVIMLFIYLASWKKLMASLTVPSRITDGHESENS